MTQPLTLAVDRAMAVPPGAIVKTAYVPVEDIRMRCRDTMSIGDVNNAYQKLLQIGANSPFPSPYGEWVKGNFELIDGRHEFIASLMLGKTHILVAWIEHPQS